MRLFLHAGFHKTGSTSLQETLRANRHALAPDIRLILRPRIKALCEAARGWSASASELDLGLVAYEAALLGESLASETAEQVVISAEDLCGHMPGRRGVKSYSAAPRLMRTMADAIKAALPEVELAFLFTTRDAQSWLTSSYAQHLRASRMRLSFRDYHRMFSPAADLDSVVANIAAALPGCAVHSAPLAACAPRPLGPAEALLDLLDLAAPRRAALVPHAIANAAPGLDLNAALLELNQSDLPDLALRAAKRTLLQGHQ
ncbi:MAG: hypothetical protein ACSHWZ_10370 [Sulfitobacter sp.]